MTLEQPAPSSRTTVRRGRQRAAYAREVVDAIADAGLVAHVAVDTEDGPLVLPTAYGRIGDHLYVHGASANHLLGAAAGRDVCVAITVVDGIVVGRSPFHNSMNYRALVVRGVAVEVEGDEKIAGLRAISDHVTDTWEHGRVPTESEIRRTLVLRVPLDECSAKVRTGGPGDEPEDLAGPHWGGHVPIEQSWGEPVPAADLSDPTIRIPASVAMLAGEPLP